MKYATIYINNGKSKELDGVLKQLKSKSSQLYPLTKIEVEYNFREKRWEFIGVYEEIATPS